MTRNALLDKLLGLLGTFFPARSHECARRSFFYGALSPFMPQAGLFMSYAIIRTGGKQFRAEPGKSLRVPSLLGEAGTAVEFNDVLLGSDGNSIRTGVPTLSGAKVSGEIVKHGLGEKIVVFKFKRRKNYARKQGHRQKFTEVRIKEITLG
ncbi:MAG: 50S ribosomal protein L21 [Gemmatimonas sp.]